MPHSVYLVGNRSYSCQLKSAILQLNTRYTENANKTNCMEFISEDDECSPNPSDLNPLKYHDAQVVSIRVSEKNAFFVFVRTLSIFHQF